MVRKRTLYLFGTLFFLSVLLLLGQVKAHNPSNMTLTYNSSNETLSVTISHSSANFNTHYIFEVNITLNGISVVNQSYTSQPSNTFTYEYIFTASDGDVIEVTARCTQAGIITRSISVGQPNENIPGYIGLLLVIGVSSIILISIKYKKAKNKVV